MDLEFGSIEALATHLRTGELSSLEVTRALLDRLAINGGGGAFLTVCADVAMEQAAAADRALGEGRDAGPLCGVPVAVKDIIETRGIATSCGTASLREWRPERDAAVVERLREAGAVLIGKLATYEFAISRHPEMPPPPNPWGSDYWSGGSSNGSAAAVSAGLCFGAIGTDTGGSIRIPSAVCGTTGLKPSYGRVSCFGVHPLAEGLDTVGPMARSAADAALIFEAISGLDERDPASRAFTANARADGLRIGIDRAWLDIADAAIMSAIEDAILVFVSNGARVVEIDLGTTFDVTDAAMTLIAVGAAASHPGLTAETEALFGPALAEFVRTGRQLPATAYFAAEQAQRRLQARLGTLFRSVDALILPVTHRTDICQEAVDAGGPEMLSPFVKLNSPANIAGNPSLALPCGKSSRGLPIGLQIVGPIGSDEMLLDLGKRFQSVTNWHGRNPRDDR